MSAGIPYGLPTDMSLEELAKMFGKAPMGAPQSFTGTSGTVVAPEPEAAPAQATAPAPAPLSLRIPPRAVAPAPAPVSEAPEIDRGGPVLPDFKPAAPVVNAPKVPAADMPAPGAVPTSGNLPALPTAATPSPAPAAAPLSLTHQKPADPAAAGEGFDFGGALKNFRANGGGDLLVGLGTGLMSTRGFGQGLATGFQNAEKAEQQRAVTGLANAELALKQGKALREAKGENATKAYLTSMGMDENLATSAMANPAVLQSVLSQLNKDPSRVTIGGNIYELKHGEKPSEANLLGPAEPGVDTVRAKAQAQAEGSAAGKPDEPFNLSKGQTRYDANGKVIVAAPGEETDAFTRESKLRGEFNKGLGTFNDVHEGYGRIIAATRQRETNPSAVSPASDMSLVFGFMKMLDPTSVVREGEYATAKNATGVPDQVRNAYNKAMNGEFLTPDQRQDFLGQAGELYGTARKGADVVAGRYRNLAGQYGVDPERTAFLPPAPEPPRVGQARTKQTSPAAGGAPLGVGGSLDAGGGVTIRRVK